MIRRILFLEKKTTVFFSSFVRTITSQALLFPGNGTWKAEEKKFLLTFVGEPLVIEFNYFFLNNHKTLTLTPVNGTLNSSQ